jgi:hypothetical protein
VTRGLETRSGRARIDKVSLSKRRRYRETPEVVDGVRRIIRAIGKRVATEDPDDLLLLVALEREVRQAWATAIAGLRRSGYSDSQIGAVLSTTKQAIQQHWPRSSTNGGRP